MRPEVKEYAIDWMLCQTLLNAYKSAQGSMDEFREMIKYVPYFEGILSPIVEEGKPGILFLDLVSKYFENIILAKQRGYKTAISTFCFSPAILYAMDIVPITLELVTAIADLAWRRGTTDFSDFCNEAGFTETSCSSQRGALGAYLSGLGQNIDLVITDSPGICDTNANSFAFASAYMDKPIYQLDYPPTLTDSQASFYHREDYKALIKFLEKHTGKKLDQDRLKQVLQEMQKQDEIISELEDYQMLVPNPFPLLYNLFLYAGRFFYAGMPEYTKVLYAMLEKVSENAAKGISGLKTNKENLRALFCYIDHYTASLKLWKWLDRYGITHMGNILSRFWSDSSPYMYPNDKAGYVLDTSSLDTMIDSIAAQNSRMPMVRSIRGPYDAPNMWLEDTLSLAKLYNVSCIIYNGTPGCRNTWGMVKLLARDTEKAGFPTHIMYADAFDDRVESWETTELRLSEFFNVRRLL